MSLVDDDQSIRLNIEKWCMYDPALSCLVLPTFLCRKVLPFNEILKTCCFLLDRVLFVMLARLELPIARIAPEVAMQVEQCQLLLNSDPTVSVWHERSMLESLLQQRRSPS
jgi:hypothetical protein